MAAIVLCSHGTRAQAIRYNLIDGATGDQQGHTLSGFIEFDSPCGGACTAANIMDFTFSVSGPSDYSYSYQAAGDVELSSSRFVHAGPTRLSVLLGGGGGGEFSLLDSTNEVPYLTWRKHPVNPWSVYESSGPSGGWITGLIGAQNVVIGTVPEPASLNLIAIGLLAIRLLRIDYWRAS
jgi:hypothetical protein